MPTAMVLTSTGKNTTERRKPRSEIGDGQEDGQQQAEHDLQRPR